MDFVELLDAPSANGDAGTDRCTVALSTGQIKQNTVVTVGIQILQQRGRFTDVEDDDIDISVVEYVPKSDPSSAFGRVIRQTSFFGDLIEGSVSVIAVQQERLAETRAGLHRVHLG